IIAFDHVDFRYTPDSGLSLQNITFQLKRNTVLGIIGPTGSGKTTLTQLIPRFYDVSSGTVIMDGMDVRSWQLDHLRQQIALVP
ncbi:ATP-binding cassette domain-containing protein, partial [Pseudomonas aeruginosa]